MTIEQIVEIPTNRRITLEVPWEIPAGGVALTFTPVPASFPAGRMAASSEARGIERDAVYLNRKAREARDRELFELHADELNAEALDVLSYQSLNL
jgi:hypothetical protein